MYRCSFCGSTTPKKRSTMEDDHIQRLINLVENNPGLLTSVDSSLFCSTGCMVNYYEKLTSPKEN